MRRFFLLLSLASMLPSLALAQSCLNLAKDSAAYQTCMLRAENNRRERDAGERLASDQKQKQRDTDDRKYELLKQESELLKEVLKLCEKSPTEDCESLGRRHGLVQKMEQLKAERNSL